MWIDTVSKSGIILEMKSFKNWRFQNMSKTKNVLLKWYCSMKKKLTMKVRFLLFLTIQHYWTTTINSLVHAYFLPKIYLLLYPSSGNLTTHIAITIDSRESLHEPHSPAPLAPPSGGAVTIIIHKSPTANSLLNGFWQ